MNSTTQGTAGDTGLSLVQNRLIGVGPRDPMEIIDEACDLHNVNMVFACVSGGTDSNISGLIASRHQKFRGVVAVDTTIAIDETIEYIKNMCDANNWPLWMETTPHGWLETCSKFGLFGPAFHHYAYSYLKERAFRLVRKKILQLTGEERVGFISGARRFESKLRQKTVQYHHRDGRTVWINPIADFMQCDKDQFTSYEKLEQSEVSKIMCLSGD